MKTTKFLGVLAFLCLLQIPLTAQVDSTNLDEYFDDGGMSSSIHLLKIDVAPILHNHFVLIYERSLFRRMSIQLGVGPVLPYNIPTPIELVGEDFVERKINSAPTSGFILRGDLKFYYLEGSSQIPDGSYYSLTYRRTLYQFSDDNPTDGRTAIHDFLMGYGIVNSLGDRFYVEPCIGLGVLIKNVESPVSAERELIPGFAYMFSLSLGTRL
ncbi:MAG: hypothetical protein MRZ79_26365 [Bacteroidia bacterium]|nr:hypothetical protein [Bacteroidia bacterium]